ncbi:MAG: hypothetical protein JWN46_3373, partial [Acidimicrobiales bacterium]|nr:hypothetical protein [Acidimicrobiales bacterium]
MPDPVHPPPPEPPLRPCPPGRVPSWLSELLDHPAISPGRVILGALGLALAVVGGWWLLRPPPAPIEASLPRADAGPSAGPAPSGPAPAAG